jgi:hypothetical protein
MGKSFFGSSLGYAFVFWQTVQEITSQKETACQKLSKKTAFLRFPDVKN